MYQYSHLGTEKTIAIRWCLFSRKFYGKLQIRSSNPPTVLQDILPHTCRRLKHTWSQYMNSPPFFFLTMTSKGKKKGNDFTSLFFFFKEVSHFSRFLKQSSFYLVILRYIMTHTFGTRHFSNFNLFLTSTRTNKIINANHLATSSKKIRILPAYMTEIANTTRTVLMIWFYCLYQNSHR